MVLDQANVLTLEQEALIPVYQAKWREMTLSTEPIDPQVATSVLSELYAKLRLSHPTFKFFDSPYAALSSGILAQAGDSIHCQLENRLENLFWSLLRIQFADGFGVYVYHGTRLPAKYGALSPAQWRSRWLLEETDPELKQVLIQGIGYPRLCRELSVTQFSTHQEDNLRLSKAEALCYRQLQITCPSTGASQIVWISKINPNLSQDPTREQ